MNLINKIESVLQAIADAEGDALVRIDGDVAYYDIFMSVTADPPEHAIVADTLGSEPPARVDIANLGRHVRVAIKNI